MILRNFVTFKAGFPDDSKWDDQNNQIAPGGKIIADYLANELSSLGLVSTQVKQHSFYGWSWELRISNRQFWLLLQYPDPWLLISQPRLSIIDRLFCRQFSQSHFMLLEMIDYILRHDQRFVGVKWYTKKEYEQNSPVDGENE